MKTSENDTPKGADLPNHGGGQQGPPSDSIAPERQLTHPAPLGLGCQGRVIRVRSIGTARRLLGKIITEIQKAQIDHETARLLVYCLSVYGSITKDHTLEARIEELEKKIWKKEHGNIEPFRKEKA